MQSVQDPYNWIDWMCIVVGALIIIFFWVLAGSAACLQAGSIKNASDTCTIGAKIITLRNFVVSNSFPRLCNQCLHYRIAFELFPWLCNFLCCCKAYRAHIGLHYTIVFEIIERLCNLFLHYRIGLNYLCNNFGLNGNFFETRDESNFPETGRIRFQRARFQTPNSVSFLALTEFRGESSVSSSQPMICAPKRTHRVFAELTEFAAELSEAQ